MGWLKREFQRKFIAFLTVLLVANGFLFALPLPAAASGEVSQYAYAWRLNDGGETDASWATTAASMPVYGVPRIDTSMQLRVGFANTSSVTPITVSPQIEVGQKGPTDVSCADVSTWNQVGSSSAAWTISTGVEPSTRFAGDRLPAGGDLGNFVAGGYLAGNDWPTPVELAQGEWTEYEFIVSPDTEHVMAGGDYCFRITDGGDPGIMTYDSYPEATVATGAVPIQNAVRWRTDNGSEAAATWAAAENATASFDQQARRRLRFGLANSGSDAVPVPGGVSESGHGDIYAMAVDGPNNYGYFTGGNHVYKMRLSDLAVVADLSFEDYDGWDGDVANSNFTTASIDPGNHFLYLGMANLNPYSETVDHTHIIKVNLSNFTSGGATVLSLPVWDPALTRVWSSAIDIGNQEAYFSVGGDGGDAGRVVKVHLSPFGNAGSFVTGTTASSISAIDALNQKLYFAASGYSYAPNVIRHDLTAFGADPDGDSLILGGGDVTPMSMAIDPVLSGGHLYVGAYGGDIRRVDLGTFLEDGLIDTTGGSESTVLAAMDSASGYVYFAGGAPNLNVYQVKLSDFSLVGQSHQEGFCSNSEYYGLTAIAFDPTNGGLFVGTRGCGYGSNNVVVKTKTFFNPAPRLEYGLKSAGGGACSDIAASDWFQVGVGPDWDMSGSTYFSDDGATATTNADPESDGGVADYPDRTFTPGKAYDDSSQSAAFTLRAGQFTEMEFSLEAAASVADGTDYCFRLTDSGAPLGTYDNYAEVRISGADNPAPTTGSISPTNKAVDDAGFFLTVNGTGFTTSSVVRFDGYGHDTTYVSSTQLQAWIPWTDLSDAGIYPITVFSPTPGGGLSNGQDFTVQRGRRQRPARGRGRLVPRRQEQRPRRARPRRARE